jgi:predicted tellurium resistance membrane protein TerC
MDALLKPEALLSLLTLSLMEIVLGIDNIVFISILVAKLQGPQQEKARRLGLALALGIRLGLLFSIKWIMRLTAPLFTVWGTEITGRKLILLGGGLFLVAKSTHEIYEKLEGEEAHGAAPGTGTASFGLILVQILLLDIVFSLDSVITAVGMAQEFAIMAAAMIIAVGVMLVFAKAVGDFVNRHPSMKILALSFLLLIGVMLVAEGWGQHIEKGYIYFAMAFSLVVELLNMRFRKKQQPVQLHGGTRRLVKPG